ncbi:MAG: hypothetical protein ABR579_02740 [Actinomycetota bacterium]
MAAPQNVDITNQIFELYGVPLDRFTATRNELVKQLSAEGHKDEATSVKTLKKPSVSVWTINQLARTHDDLMSEVLAARADLRSARSGSEMRAAVDRRKRAVSALVTVSRDVLEEAGHAATAQTLDSISRALLAASDEETEERMRLGVLDGEPEAAAFEGDLEAAFVDAASSQTDDRTRDEAERLAGAAEEAERIAREARWEADRARDEGDRLARIADNAEEKAERARGKADDALTRLKP